MNFIYNQLTCSFFDYLRSNIKTFHTMNYKIIALALLNITLFSCKNEVTSDQPKKTTTEISSNEQSESTLAENLKTTNFMIGGMTCQMGCANLIETKLSEKEGVKKATIDFENKTAQVEFDANKIALDDIKSVVESAADGKTYKVSSQMHIHGK